jgi:agmatine deiminase
MLAEASRKNSIVLIGGSIFERAGGKNYNTCLVFSEKGKILGKYRKIHLPGDEHYYEQDYFESGTRYSVVETSQGRLGTLICFDQWYPEAARINRLMGADILFYPTALGWVKGVEQVEGDWKQAWEAVQVGHAVANSLVVCAVNRVGLEDEITFWGGSFVCNQFGNVLLRAGNGEGVFVVECHLDLQRIVEEGWGFLRNRKKKTYGALTE